VSNFFRSVVRTVLGRRRVQSLRSLIRDSSLFTQQATVAEPGSGKVVVVAPHMDDETLGCGGTIARHVLAGAQVTVVFLTDGRYGASYAGMTEPERALRRTEIVAVRRAEAQCAARILGVQSLSFLDAEDGSLRTDRRVPALLRAILEREQPHCVYLPSFLEQHRDHRAANGVLLTAAAGTGLQFECRGYEVWTPLIPNCVVKIDTTVALKKRALACYQSQLEQMDYVHAALGLNAHRSLALGGNAGGFAEAFQALPLADYMRLYRAIPRSLLS
jgi:LmbE family N-acetylglucosaminyl deacetylase